MEVLRYAAFSDDPAGGNPAGVVLDAAGMSEDEMLAVAADVGYSETAFITAAKGNGDYDVRYFSREAEVAFCGHATVAAAVALPRCGTLVFHTRSGPVAVEAREESATLTSVEPRIADLPDDDLDALLAALHWRRDELDPSLPTRIACAGVYHPVIAALSHDRLRKLDYDFDALGELMRARDWTTIQLVWREHESLFHARDPFPVGGVTEDPATGAAAAALGGYLRELGLVSPPADITVVQGEDLGRPGRLDVHIPEAGGIAVTGTAVAL
ncbi:MAG TPA: PhzF family phenazine biosynthesis isomerase [Thermoleophilaceae bacterium]